MMRVTTERESAPSRIVSGRMPVEVRGEGFVDITRPVHEWVAEIGAADGLLTVFTVHTTASLVLQENADINVRRDLMTSFSRLAPARDDYRHAEEGPDDMPGHIKAMLTDVSVAIPVAGGRLRLGTWQAIYFVEHRTEPRSREVLLSYIGC